MTVPVPVGAAHGVASPQATRPRRSTNLSMPAVKTARAARPAATVKTSRNAKPASAAKQTVKAARAARPAAAAAKPAAARAAKPAARSAKPAAARAAKPAAARSAKPTTARSARAAKPAAARSAKPAAARSAKPAAAPRPARPAAPARTARRTPSPTNGLVSIAEQLVKGTIRPRDVVLLTRDRIQETLDDAAARGRMTSKDANDLVAELLRHGRSHGDGLLGEVEALLGRGRAEVGQAARRARGSEPVARIVRGADRARRTATALPIAGYDQLRAAQVPAALKDLRRPQLRTVLAHERRNANRKSVVAAIEKALR